MMGRVLTEHTMNGGDLAGLKGSLVSLGVSWLLGRGNWFGGVGC